VKNLILILGLSGFAFTAPGFAEENSSSTTELLARGEHGGGSGHSQGGSGHSQGASARRQGSSGGHGNHAASHGHRSSAHNNARSHYRHGRFDNGYYHSHFGPGYPIFWGGPGFWFGAPWFSPFWFGGVYWGFGAGIVFLPEWQVSGWYVASVATGYVLLNPAFPSVQVPVVVQINLAPPADQDDADESDE
jgi:hypothetical protein